MSDRQTLASALTSFERFDDLYDDWLTEEITNGEVLEALTATENALHVIVDAARERLTQLEVEASPVGAVWHNQVSAEFVDALRRVGASEKLIAGVSLPRKKAKRWWWT